MSIDCCRGSLAVGNLTSELYSYLTTGSKLQEINLQLVAVEISDARFIRCLSCTCQSLKDGSYQLTPNDSLSLSWGGVEVDPEGELYQKPTQLGLGLQACFSCSRVCFSLGGQRELSERLASSRPARETRDQRPETTSDLFPTTYRVSLYAFALHCHCG